MLLKRKEKQYLRNSTMVVPHPLPALVHMCAQPLTDMYTHKRERPETWLFS